jgi:hypothetical protein
MSRRGIVAGVAIAALYVVVSQLSFHNGLVPVRPLYDGTTTVQPYRWVDPPPDLKHGNVAPTSASGSFKIGSTHTPPVNLNTDDGQVSVIFPPDGIVPMAGQTSVKLEIKPLDPAKVAGPPAGFDFDGNAYSITGTYVPSGKPLQIPKAVCDLNNANACATVVLRYAFSATKLFLLNGQTWTEVKSQTAQGALQIYGLSEQLGTFVAVDPHTAGGPKAKSQTGNIIAFVIGLAAILLGTLVARLRATRKRRAREGAREKKGAKKAPPQKPAKPKRPKKPEKQQGEEKPWWRD